MGSGHFLLGVVKFLEAKIVELQDTDSKLKGTIDFDKVRKEVLKNCVYGIDINSLATQLAKFSLWIYTSQKGMELEPLSDKLKFGNSLVDLDGSANHNFVWKDEFEDVFEQGGFDSVVGNPQYLGERGNKEKFRYTRENGKLSSETYKRKMDLFYWFIMKGIEVLKPSGILSYITTNYWPTADGAETLKSYMIKNGALTEYVDFLNAKIFKDAKGQCNSLFKFEKTKKWSQAKISVHRASTLFENESLEWDSELPVRDKKYFSSEVQALSKICPLDKQWTISKRSGENASGPDQSEQDVSINRDNYTKFIGKGSVSMGVQTSCDKVTSSLLKLALKKGNITQKEKDSFKLKEGIFVISKSISNDKGIERDLLVNWYKNSDLGFYYSNKAPDEVIIYVDSQVNIKKCPRAKKHLQKYRSLLASREQANNDENNWYWIRGAKREKIYGKTTIVCPYRSKVPKFTLSNNEIYGAGDVYYIYNFFGYTPEAMLGYLNSSFVAQWFSKYGKKKGNLYELYQTPLSEIPVPSFSKVSEKRIHFHVEEIFKHIQEYRSAMRDESVLKKALDIIAEFKVHSLEALQKDLNDDHVIKMAKQLLREMAEIDSIVYSEMLDESALDAA